MKNKRVYVVVFSVLILMSVHAQKNSFPNRPIVVLDAGHGGRDYGALGMQGILEKEIALDIVLECVLLNRILFKDTLELYLTRYTDTLISLGDRTRLAKALTADIFVSVHCNQAPDPKAQGTEVFVYDRKGKETDAIQKASTRLAEKVSRHLTGKLGTRNRGVKHADFQVLRDTRYHCQAIMVETGFISNGEEAAHATKKSSISAIALALLESLITTIYHE